jgi:hypothetical protein
VSTTGDTQLIAYSSTYETMFLNKLYYMISKYDIPLTRTSQASRCILCLAMKYRWKPWIEKEVKRAEERV